MYLNLVVVLLLSVWAAGDDSHDLTEEQEKEQEEQEKYISVFEKCSEAYGYKEDKWESLDNKLNGRGNLCKKDKNHEHLKEWTTCFFEGLGALDDSGYRYGHFNFTSKNDREKNAECEKRLKSKSIPKDLIACTMMSCMNGSDIESENESDIESDNESDIESE